MGGGGSNKQSTPKVAGVSLLSNNTAQLIDVISEGEIKGLVDGFKSVYFNETPLMNSQGGFNFNGVTCDSRLGTPTQTTMTGVNGIETFVSVNAKVEQGTPIVRTIVNPNADYVRLKLATPQLQEQTANGDVINARVDFNIEIAENGQPYRAYTQDATAWEPLQLNASNQYVTSSVCVGYRMVVKWNALATQPWVHQNNLSVTSTHARYTALTPVYTTQTAVASQWAKRLSGNSFGVIQPISNNFNMPTPSDFMLYYAVQFDVALTQGLYLITPPSGWQVVSIEQKVNKNLFFSGRATSAYEKEFVISLPKAIGSPWSIRVTRATPNSTSQQLQNDLYFSSYVEGVEAKLPYQNTAVANIEVDASLFGNNIPTRGYLIDGVKVKIPSNYNPFTRAYDESGGYWNGTFATEWTNNPVWILYDILTNPRYGGGQFISQAQVDKFDFYEAGKYCDELVPVAGSSALEPRYTFNYWFANAEPIYDIANKVANVFHGMVYVASGIVRLTIDKPKAMTHVFSQANVLSTENGVAFQYSTAGAEQTSSVVQVTYSDPQDAYKPKVVSVEDPDLIDIYGFQTRNETGFGVVSEGQARRHGVWALDTDKNQYNTVSFGTGIEGADVTLGDIIGIYDPTFQTLRLSGRVVAFYSNIGGSGFEGFKTDAPVATVSGETYSCYVTMNDGSLRLRTVLPCDANGVVTYGNSSYFRFAQPVTTAQSGENNTTEGNALSPNNVWGINSSSNTPTEYYVISKSERTGEERFIYDITAVQYDRTKYARIDNSVIATSTAVSQPDITFVLHTNLTGTSWVSNVNNTATKHLNVSWTPSLDFRVRRYSVYYREDSTQTYTQAGSTSLGTLDLGMLSANIYDIRVDAETLTGTGYVVVGSISNTIDFALGNVPPATPTGFSYSINGTNIAFKWDANIENDLDGYEIRYTPAKTGTVWEGTPLLVYIKPPVTEYTTVFQEGTYYLKARDSYGAYSPDADSVVTIRRPDTQINVVEVLTEHPSFSGVKTDTTVVNNRLTMTDPFNIQTAYYNFANSVNLGGVYVSRFTSNILFEVGDYFSWVSFMPNIASQSTMATNDVNTIGGSIDVATIENVASIGQLDYLEGMLELQIAISMDGTNYNPYVKFEAGDYEGWAFRFRVVFRSFGSRGVALIRNLSVTCDMPDRILSAENVTLASDWNTLTFSPAFKGIPNLQVTPKNMEANERAEVQNVTQSSAQVRIVHGNGNMPSGRIIDWLATGYGSVL